MDTRASGLQPARQMVFCCCESPICPADHPSRYVPTMDLASTGIDMSWLAGGRNRLGLTAALVRERVIRRSPRHA